PKGEEPQGRRGRSYGTDAPLLASGNPGIKKQPSSVTLLQADEGEGSRAAVDQMANQRGEQSGSGARSPVVNPSQRQGQQSQGADVPPNQAKQKSPGKPQSQIGSFIAE